MAQAVLVRRVHARTGMQVQPGRGCGCIWHKALSNAFRRVTGVVLAMWMLSIMACLTCHMFPVSLHRPSNDDIQWLNLGFVRIGTPNKYMREKIAATPSSKPKAGDFAPSPPTLRTYQYALFTCVGVRCNSHE